MRNDLKNRTPLGTTVDNKILADLKEYSAETGVPLSKLLDKAITMLLEATKK